MYTYKKERRYSSDCHIFIFSTTDCRMDISIGQNKTHEYLSKINGSPNKDEKVIAKVNSGFLALNNYPEYIGTRYDEELYYNRIYDTYPVAVLWNNNVLSAEYTTNPARYSEYKVGAQWAVRCSWLLVENGVRSHHLTEEELFYMPESPRKRRSRTLFGQLYNGNFILCVVESDGLKNRGITIKQSAELMIDYDCRIAFDIGGDCGQMLYKDTVMARAYKGNDRRVPSAFIVYSKNDKLIQTTSPIRQGIVTSSSGITVREKPRIYKSNIIGFIHYRGRIDILDICDGGWYKIKYDNIIGYVNEKYIKLI